MLTTRPDERYTDLFVLTYTAVWVVAAPWAMTAGVLRPWSDLEPILLSVALTLTLIPLVPRGSAPLLGERHATRSVWLVALLAVPQCRFGSELGRRGLRRRRGAIRAVRAAAAALLVAQLAGCGEPAAAPSAPPPSPALAPPAAPPRLSAAVTAAETEATPALSEAPLAMASYDAVGPSGPTRALAVRYALPARLASRYAPIERGLHLVAARSTPEARAWIAPLTREGSFDPEATGGEPARGALVVDPRALLGLPGEEAEYALALWIEELASPVLRVRLPASDEAAPAPPGPPVGVGISELTREVDGAPVLRATTGCLSFAADVASGAEPLLIAVAAPEPARARAFVVARPHGYAPSMVVTVSGCELLLPLPEDRLHAFALALRGDDVATLALDPALPPASARPIAVPPCDEDGECVLVTGGCVGPAATHHDVAAAVDERHRLILSVAGCSGAVPRVPVRAVCRAHTCTTEPLDHPEWRVCRRDRDCTVEWRHCHVWEPIATSAAEAAHAAWVGPECPGIAPVPPPVRCVQGSCTVGWVGP